MLITNWWGIFFTFGIPVILWGIGIYYSGIEEGRIRYARNNKVQFRKDHKRSVKSKKQVTEKY